MDKRTSFRRRMVTTRPIKQGEPLALTDIDFKRPGTGIHPDEAAYVIGRRLTRDVEAEEELEWADLQ
jgi:N-acetylneuraminate synthase